MKHKNKWLKIGENDLIHVPQILSKYIKHNSINYKSYFEVI